MYRAKLHCTSYLILQSVFAEIAATIHNSKVNKREIVIIIDSSRAQDTQVFILILSL